MYLKMRFRRICFVFFSIYALRYWSAFDICFVSLYLCILFILFVLVFFLLTKSYNIKRKFIQTAFSAFFLHSLIFPAITVQALFQFIFDGTEAASLTLFFSFVRFLAVSQFTKRRTDEKHILFKMKINDYSNMRNH